MNTTYDTERAIYLDEEAAHGAFRAAFEARDFDEIRRLCPSGSGMGFLAYNPECFLTSACSAYVRGALAEDLRLIEVLLEAGHPASGVGVNKATAPLYPCLHHPGPHTRDLFDKLLRHGANVSALVEVFEDWFMPVWTAVLHAGHRDQLECMLANGWRPAVTPAAGEEEFHPIKALNSLAKNGPLYRDFNVPRDPVKGENLATELLQVLVQHGWQPQAPGTDENHPATDWYNRFWSDFEAGRVLGEVVQDPSSRPSRPRL